MKSLQQCVIIGAGGHAKSVLDAALAAKVYDIIGLIDQNPDLKSCRVLGLEVLGGDECLAELRSSGVSAAILGVGGTGDNSLREQVFNRTVNAGFKIVGVVHPSAVVSPFAEVDPSAQILAGVSVGPLTKIGRGTIINTGAVVEHDCEIGDFTHVASGAVLCGGVRVEALAHVGAGATIRQDLRIGERAVVGAGAAVVRDVRESEVIVGVPGRMISEKSNL